MVREDLGSNDGATTDVATCNPPRSHNTCDGFENLQVDPLARSRRRRNEAFVLKFCTWNVNSLVENDGSIETARHERSLPVTEDKQIQIVLHKIQNFNFSVAGLQETEWFGDLSI